MFSVAFFIFPRQVPKVKEMLDAIGNGHPKQSKMVGRPWGLRVGGLISLFSGFLPRKKPKGGRARYITDEFFLNHKYYNHGRPEKKNPAIEQRKASEAVW
jgi:hypothetical protein